MPIFLPDAGKDEGRISLPAFSHPSSTALINGSRCPDLCWLRLGAHVGCESHQIL